MRPREGVDMRLLWTQRHREVNPALTSALLYTTALQQQEKSESLHRMEERERKKKDDQGKPS